MFSIGVPNTGSTLGLGVGGSGITGSQLSDGFLVEASLLSKVRDVRAGN